MKRSDTARELTREFYRGNCLVVALRVISTLLEVLANLAVAWLIQQIIDLASGAGDTFSLEELLLISLGGLGLFTLASACDYLGRPRFIARAMMQYKQRAFEKLSEKGISAFSGENSSLYLSALSNDAAALETRYLPAFFGILAQSLLFAAALLMMLMYSPVLTLISVALSLLPVLASLLTGNRMARAEEQVSDRNQQYISTLRDSLAGFSVIKAFRAEARMCRIFAESVRRAAEAGEKRGRLNILIWFFSNAAGIIVQLGVMLVGAYLSISDDGLTVGTVIVFVQLLNYVLNPISTIPGYLADRKAGRALIEKLAAALDENVREEGSVEKRELTDGIRLENLSFAYEPGKPVLKDVNFCFHAGKSYALVGTSGSGKSTLLTALMADSGEYGGKVLYDGVDVHDIRSEALYDMISSVQQNVFLFNATIRDNITMFADFPDADVERAAELSGLKRLMEEKGADFLCGENGSGLSGGEKQRISIARALLRKSCVLLADEATASLDRATAAQVTDAILGLDGITRIVVTHALEAETLRRYDCILTMKDGQVQETGPFDDLMEKKGYFYSLYTVAQ